MLPPHSSGLGLVSLCVRVATAEAAADSPKDPFFFLISLNPVFLEFVHLQRCLYSVTVAMCMRDSPSCGWSVFFAYGCVVYHAILPERSCSEFCLLRPPKVSSLLPCVLQSRTGGPRGESLQISSNLRLKRLKPTHLEPLPHSKRSRCNEKPMHCNRE